MIRLCSHIQDTKTCSNTETSNVLYSALYLPCADPRLKCKSKSAFLIHESGFEVIFIISVFFQALAG